MQERGFNSTRCSFIYKKGAYEDDTCPICGTYAATDIYKEQRLDNTLNENGLHKVFFDRVPRVYDEMNLSIWQTLGSRAWKTATAEEQAFLIFCHAFLEVTGAPTKSESDYWDAALEAEGRIRGYLVEHEYRVTQKEEFDLSLIADGLQSGRKKFGRFKPTTVFLCAEKCFRSMSEKKMRENIRKL